MRQMIFIVLLNVITNLINPTSSIECPDENGLLVTKSGWTACPLAICRENATWPRFDAAIAVRSMNEIFIFQRGFYWKINPFQKPWMINARPLNRANHFD